MRQREEVEALLRFGAAGAVARLPRPNGWPTEAAGVVGMSGSRSMLALLPDTVGRGTPQRRLGPPRRRRARSEISRTPARCGRRSWSSAAGRPRRRGGARRHGRDSARMARGVRRAREYDTSRAQRGVKRRARRDAVVLVPRGPSTSLTWCAVPAVAWAGTPGCVATRVPRLRVRARSPREPASSTARMRRFGRHRLGG